MMDFRDSRGRTISLLNDDLPRLKTATLPPLQSAPRSSYYSGVSNDATRGRSPPSLTPSLCRSDSSDSAAFHSPSPPTPLSSGFEPLRHALPNRHKSQIEALPGIDSLSRRSSALSSSHLLPSPSPTSPSRLGASHRSPMDFSPHTPLGGVSDFAFPTATALLASPQSSFDPLALQAASSSLSAQQPLPLPASFDAAAAAAAAAQVPLSTPQPPPPSAAHRQQQQQQSQGGAFPAPVTQQRSQKKNSYPCPLSKQYNCPEYFTTSGHAARHAKKHTGKKDAICPECGKGFTRKDNMEQHRRTHANGRHSTSSSSSNNNASAGSSTSASSSTSGAKQVPKVTDADESKARKKAQQQRKARPSSISTSAPMPLQMAPGSSASLSQPSTATSAVPPTIDLLDPALRGQAAFAFSPSSGDFGMYPFDQAGMALDGTSMAQHFQAPHAPMRASSSQGSATRMRHEPRARDGMNMARPRAGPTSPSLAPKLDALALVAEGVRRRDSDSSG